MKTKLVFNNLRELVQFAAKRKGRIPYINKERDPCLWFVKDDGIYLMPSNWDREKPKKGAVKGTPPPKKFVIYAEGYNPTKDRKRTDPPGTFYQKVIDAVGGDDFAEVIELPDLSLDEIAKYPMNKELSLTLTVTEKSIQMKWSATPATN